MPYGGLLWGRCSGHVPLGRGPGADLGHAGEIISIDRPGKLEEVERERELFLSFLLNSDLLPLFLCAYIIVFVEKYNYVVISNKIPCNSM